MEFRLNSLIINFSWFTRRVVLELREDNSMSSLISLSFSMILTHSHFDWWHWSVSNLEISTQLKRSHGNCYRLSTPRFTRKLIRSLKQFHISCYMVHWVGGLDLCWSPYFNITWSTASLSLHCHLVLWAFSWLMLVWLGCIGETCERGERVENHCAQPRKTYRNPDEGHVGNVRR